MQPEYVTIDGLAERLREELSVLSKPDAAWWESHRVQPFPATDGEHSHFVVAQSDERVLVFFDDEDEFGAATLNAHGRISDAGLIGDLADAIHWFLSRLDQEPT